MHQIVPLLLLSSLVAQSPAPKVPTFHLTAGEYPVAQLLQQVEQAVRAPIRTKDAGDLATLAPIRLQCDLVLPQQAWADVVGALLSMRDLVVVRDAERKGHEVLPSPRGSVDWVHERAQALSVPELFERASFTGPVRVVVKTTTAIPIVTNTLRVHFPPARQTLAYEAVDGGMQLVGLADSVRFAVTTIASVAPDVADILPARATPPWPRIASKTRHRLEPGDYQAAQIVDRLAKALGRNIVLAPNIVGDDDPIPVAKAIEGDDFSFEEQLTSLLWTTRVIVLQVSGTHGLYEAMPVAPGAWPPAARFQELSAAELLARPSLVAWMATTLAPDGLTQSEMIGVGRATMLARGAGSLSMGSGRAESIRLMGLSTDVVAVLQGIERKKAGK